MSTFAEQLQKAVEVVCPVVGVSVGRKDDRATWQIHFDGATEQQELAALAVVRSFEYVPPEPKPTLDDVLDSLPQESKDAIKAKTAARSAGVTLASAAGKAP